MGETRPSLLKRPNQKGFMGPLAILSVHQAMTELMGDAQTDELMKSAKVFRLPKYDEPVREARTAALHQRLMADYPEDSQAVLVRAGQLSANYVIKHRMTQRAQSLLASAPWPAAAWLLGKSLDQNAWTFGGSGSFEIISRVEFSLTHNPVIKGVTATHCICDYHASLLQQFFSTLVYDQLICTEVTCAARGDATCTFRLHDADEDVMAS